MSFVCRIWILPGASAAPATVPPLVGVAVPAGVDVLTHAAARTSAAAKRGSGRLADGLVGAVLQFVEPMVNALLGQQLAVRSDLGDATFVEDHDPIDVLDRR